LIKSSGFLSDDLGLHLRSMWPQEWLRVFMFRCGLTGDPQELLIMFRHSLDP
jgi:hypothetical protein